ncbi:hypothetical protein JCM8097_001429 [Rhodosporidiobolus ruineniae]
MVAPLYLGSVAVAVAQLLDSVLGSHTEEVTPDSSADAGAELFATSGLVFGSRRRGKGAMRIEGGEVVVGRQLADKFGARGVEADSVLFGEVVVGVHLATAGEEGPWR